MRVVSIIGKSGEIPAEVAAITEAIGRGVAQRGYALVCGGRDGVMQAACRGAKAEGGLTIGILPGYGTADANAWVDVALPTGLGFARNTCVAAAGDVVIAIDGSYGTLSEIAMALTLNKPVIGVGTWRAEQGEHTLPLHYATSAEEALALLDGFLEEK